MKFLNRFAALSAVAALLIGSLPFDTASAQSTSVAVVPSIFNGSVTGIGATAAINVNSQGTTLVRLSGSYSGLTGTFQGTPERAQSGQTWQTLSAIPVGAGTGLVKSITGNGLYKVNTAGYSQIRFNASALTGTANVALASHGGDGLVDVYNIRRATYSAVITGLVPVASATDLFTITGSATTVVRVSRVACSGTSTAAGTSALTLVLRSTADTGGTSTVPTKVQHDGLDVAPTAVLAAYTANPTLGTLVGAIRTGFITTASPGTSTVDAAPLEWKFGDTTTEEVTLRGAANQLAVNANGVTMASGAIVNCDITFSEE